MKNEFVEFVLTQNELTPEEIGFLQEHMPTRYYKKGDVILREGEVATESFYCLWGCARQYYLVDGEDKTTAFYTDHSCFSSHLSYINKVPSAHYLGCLEDSCVAVITWDSEQLLYKRFPHFEKLAREETERNFGEEQARMATYLTLSPEERYLELQKTRPDLLNRVPQYHLASYLGVKPESLSRIRKRLAVKVQK